MLSNRKLILIRVRVDSHDMTYEYKATVKISSGYYKLLQNKIVTKKGAERWTVLTIYCPLPKILKYIHPTPSVKG